MTHESLSGKTFKPSTANGGGPLLAKSSKHSAAKVDMAARAVYSTMMLGLIAYDHASSSLKQKCHLIAIAVLDAADRFETQ